MSALFGGESRFVLAKSGVAIPLTGTTSETLLASHTIKGGLIGPNGLVLVHHLWSANNNANAKTGRIRLGGIAGTSFVSGNVASNISWRVLTMIQNRGAENSQVGGAVAQQTSYIASINAVNTAAIDTSVDQDLVLTGQLAVGTDTLTLEAYMIELIR